MNKFEIYKFLVGQRNHFFEMVSVSLIELDFFKLIPDEVLKTSILANLYPKDLRSIRATCTRNKKLCDKIMSLYINDFADGLTALACYFNFLRCNPEQVDRSAPDYSTTIQFDFVTFNPIVPSYENTLMNVEHVQLTQTKYVALRQLHSSADVGLIRTLSNEIHLFDEIKQVILKYPRGSWHVHDDINCSKLPCHMSTSLFPAEIHKEDDTFYEHRPDLIFNLKSWIEQRLNPFKHARDGKVRLIKKFLEPYWFETRELATETMKNRSIRCGWNLGKCATSDVCLCCYFDNLKLESVRTEKTCFLCSSPICIGGLLCSKHLDLESPLTLHAKKYGETAGINRKYPTHLELVGWRPLIKSKPVVYGYEPGSIELNWRNPKFESDQLFCEFKMMFNEDDEEFCVEDNVSNDTDNDEWE